MFALRNFNLMDSSRGRSSPGCFLRVSCRILQICVWTSSLWVLLLELCTIQTLTVMGGVPSMISPWLQHHMYQFTYRYKCRYVNINSWNAKLLPRVLAHDMQWIWNTAGEHSPQCPESLYDGSLYLPARNLCDLRCDSLENIRTLESITTSPLGIFHNWPVATVNLFTTFFVTSALGLYVIASQGSFFLVNVATVALFWYDKHQAPLFFQNPQAKRRERRISWTHLSKRLEGWKSCLVLLYFYCQSEFSENAFPCFLL